MIAMSDFVFPVEAGHILMFRRAIGLDDVHWDLNVPQLAPPTFVQAGANFDPGWELRPRPGQPWVGSGREPTGSPGVGTPFGMHAEQHFEYTRPVYSGDVLHVTSEPGGQWSKQRRQGGRLDFFETVTRYRDADGSAVVTARTVGVVAVEPRQATRD